MTFCLLPRAPDKRPGKLWKLAWCNRKSTGPVSNKEEIKGRYLWLSTEREGEGERKKWRLRLTYIKVSGTRFCRRRG